MVSNSKEYMHKYYLKHREHILVVTRNYRLSHPERVESWNANRKSRNIKWKLIVIDHYSDGKLRCVCCGEKIFDFLTIDHINNNGYLQDKTGRDLYKWLIDNHFPEGYQVLCMNCNFGKMLNSGICPHEMRK